jgi:hypothetical protein
MAGVIAAKRTIPEQVDETVELVRLNDSYVHRLLELLEAGEQHHFFGLVGMSIV